MKYTKPAVVVLGAAVVHIQGAQTKPQAVLDNGHASIRNSAGAYEADE